VAPASLGDPIISCDLNLENRLLVTGTACGAIAVWPLESQLGNWAEQEKRDVERRRSEKAVRALLKGSINRNLSNIAYLLNDGSTGSLLAATAAAGSSASATTAASAAAASASSNGHVANRNGSSSANGPPNSGGASLNTDPFICRLLEPVSQEGAKHVFFQDDSLFAVIGDIHVKCWHSVQDALHGSIDNPAAVRPQQISFHRAHNYSVCATTYALRSSSNVALLTHSHNDQYLINVETMEERTIPLSLRHQTPLSFLAPKPPPPAFVAPKDSHDAASSSSDSGSVSSTLLLTLETAAGGHGEKAVKVFNLDNDSLVASIPFSRTHKFYWGFQLGCYGRRLAHVCCQNKVKVWDLSRPTEPLVKAVGHGANARVIALYYSLDGRQLLSLGTDARLNRWDAETGALLRSYDGVKGDFRLGYPTLLHVYDKLILYTADDGVYLLIDQEEAAAAEQQLQQIRVDSSAKNAEVQALRSLKA
jgi:WD40 repeat protein